jgi:hypothetical protein
MWVADIRDDRWGPPARGARRSRRRGASQSRRRWPFVAVAGLLALTADGGTLLTAHRRSQAVADALAASAILYKYAAVKIRFPTLLFIFPAIFLRHPRPGRLADLGSFG